MPAQPDRHPFWDWIVLLVTLLTLASGLLNIYSVIGPSLADRLQSLRHYFPLEFISFSRSVVLVIGFGLVVLSWNIHRRKRTAWWLAMGATLFSTVFHLTKGIDYEEASISALLAFALILSRQCFTVRSRTEGFRDALLRLGLAATVAFSYGTVGFWLLEPREFRYDFGWKEAAQAALSYLSFGAGAGSVLVPHTHYAAWFLDSLWITSTVGLLYAGYVLFRPAYYAFRLHPLELEEAKRIVERHGRSTQDFFKAWPDKSFYFSPTRESFLAYRVAADCAVVLGDPVGPSSELRSLIADFLAYCHENDWRLTFHQATPDLLDVYESLGFRRFKVGDDAVVELEKFQLEGRTGKALRSTITKVERSGLSFEVHEAPLDDALLRDLKYVSDSWLGLAGRKERQFTLGHFNVDYLRSTTVLAVRDASGELQAFLNIIPSHVPGEATLDLMRRRADSMNGVMDYLFTKVLLHCKSSGYSRFSLGMAPMAGFQPGEASSAEERAIHAFFQKSNVGFSFQGIRDYKSKFATSWEPRYILFRHHLDLARLAIALRKVSEMPEPRWTPMENAS